MNTAFAKNTHTELSKHNEQSYSQSEVRAAIYAGVIIGTKKSRAKKARKH